MAVVSDVATRGWGGPAAFLEWVRKLRLHHRV